VRTTDRFHLSRVVTSAELQHKFSSKTELSVKNEDAALAFRRAVAVASTF